MNTDTNWRITTESSEQTQQLAYDLGARLRGGEVIELMSDVGGGKTTFVRGLAKGIGSHDTVSSPSFTIANQYQGAVLTMHHLDFYRLHEPGIMRDELAELLGDKAAVTVIEWADIVADVLPEEHIAIQITALSERGRQFAIRCPQSFAYAFVGIET